MLTKIINLIGGPGVGKSTVASGLFSKLKQKKISCEYVSEYAKEVTWEETHKLLENQIHIFSEQFRRQYRLLNKVDYIITDSPLILNSIYFDYYLNKLNGRFFNEKYENLTRYFFEQSFLQFDNNNFLLSRVKEYDTNGRNQTLHEATTLDYNIRKKLEKLEEPVHILCGTEEENILEILKNIGVR